MTELAYFLYTTECDDGNAPRPFCGLTNLQIVARCKSSSVKITTSLPYFGIKTVGDDGNAPRPFWRLLTPQFCGKKDKK